MTQTIYLHIGHYKTGTTALQAAMVSNAKALSGKNVHYLDVFRHQSKHSKLAFSILRAAGVTELMHGYADKQTPQAVWDQLFKEARQSGAGAIVASTEEFMRIGAHPQAREILREVITSAQKEFDFRIVVYLRAPLSHLQSWYNQLVKMNKGPVPSFNAAVCDFMEPVHFDYGQALAPWIDIFGADALIVRPYTDDLRQKGALFADFLSIFQLTPGRWTVEDNRVQNPRMDDTLVEVTRVMQAAGASDVDTERVQNLVSRLRGATKRDSGVSMADVATRARAGLSSLPSLPGNTVDVDAFGDQLPAADDTSDTKDIETLSDLVTFLIADIKLLRTNMHKRQEELLNRVIALEKGNS